jgi:tRNA 2-thiouridine synthesizing protein A
MYQRIFIKMDRFLNPDYTIDATGKKCPDPTLDLRHKMREVEVGSTVLLLADDLGTTRDVPKYCHFIGHQLIATHTYNKPYKFLIRKGKT